ncbi:HNH endonuclease [Rhodobacter ferrooxidans]|uniref:HNH endonuclease n=1 Tax=Rhodobacter ferrooxidans TaxID=371731 RepID=UPI001E2CBBCB|nr:HNH endonuclease [Rhodobacter sp. SW2]
MKDLTRDSVLQAVAEFDRLGRDQFLSKYGFGTAKSYYIVVNGKQYDSKAIAGVAHGYARPDLGPLAFSDFSGGQAQVQRPLDRLGFEVFADNPAELRKERNPNWTRDELILALDYYLQHPGESHDDSSPGVTSLSQQINALAQLLGHGTSETLRNANGVSMKLLNFRAHDPEYTLRGQVGLQRGNRLEKELWDRFAHDQADLKRIADSIKQRIDAPDEDLREALFGPEEPEIAEAEEGRLVTRLHRFRERNRLLVKRKKESYAKKQGRLCCEACDFDFGAKYGQRGEGFIECHHTKPVSSLTIGEKTKVSDLVLLCANCHRMVHAKAPWLTVAALKALLVR